ncbi:GNAT family N-acetyltransferase [Ferruginibacter sp.]
MIKATAKDKAFIINLLAACFADNKSVNYIMAPNGNKQQRIKSLMDYSFEVCHRFGEVFLNDERTACALILYLDKKKNDFATLSKDIKLVLTYIGIGNINKAIKREAAVNALYPHKNIFYLWYIAVDTTQQQKGIGTAFLQEIMQYANTLNKDIYLETSTAQNIDWYTKMGFELYKELDLTYTLSCFRKQQ